MPIFVFDVETTGLNHEVDRIIEFGGVAFSDEGEVMGRVSTLIDPGFSIPAKITKITGITNRMIRENSKLWDDFAPTAHQWLERAPSWGGQNLQFDIKFLKEEMERVGLELPVREFADTLLIARRFLPKGKKTLGSLAAMYGVDLEEAHRALDDAEATGKILFKMAEQLGLTLDELVRGEALTLGPYALGQDPFDVMFSGLS